MTFNTFLMGKTCAHTNDQKTVEDARKHHQKEEAK